MHFNVADSNSQINSALRSIEYARMLFEKCEIGMAKRASLEAYAQAKEVSDSKALIEAIILLVRMSAEAANAAEVEKWGTELEAAMLSAKDDDLPMAWYCKGVVASYRNDIRSSQTYYLRAAHAIRKVIGENPSKEMLIEYAKIWSCIANELRENGKRKRSLALALALWKRFEGQGITGAEGALAMVQGLLREDVGDFDQAYRWYQKAHAAYLEDRNWFAHLYVQFAYARIERKIRNFAQAYWHLDLIEKATRGSELGNLISLIKSERQTLETDAIDLLIDSRKCEVTTREHKEMPLGKQYVLLGILEALTNAHSKNAADEDRGLSKADIIERVWKERYRPEVHDNKLYYNINRLRKLIEPDMKHPKYLLNWKEGYRLAPGLRVHYIGGQTDKRGRVV